MAVVAARNHGGLTKRKRNDVTEVPPGKEFDAVTGYFLETLGREDVEIRGLSRVRTSGSHAGVEREPCTVMFHGCRSRSNEDSIIANGFQVSHCVSGGRNFGTWFAYGAAYSDGGFVHVDDSGERRIFICVVGNRCVKLDNPTMRVVEQGRAFPVWLLRYWYPWNVRSARRQSQASPPSFYRVVHDGAWVLEVSLKRREEEEKEKVRRQQQARAAALKALAYAVPK